MPHITFFDDISLSFGTITFFTRTHIIFITLFLSSNNLVDSWILSVFHSLANITWNKCTNYLYAGILQKYVHHLRCRQRDTKHCRYQIHVTKWAMSDSANLTRLQSRQQTQTCSSCHRKLKALPSAKMQNQGQHFTQGKISNPCISIHWSADLRAKTKSVTFLWCNNVPPV